MSMSSTDGRTVRRDWEKARLLLASPAVQALRLVSQQFPVLRVPSVVEPQPRMQPSHKTWSDRNGNQQPLPH